MSSRVLVFRLYDKKKHSKKLILITTIDELHVVNQLYESDRSVIVSAPTGAGKTVLFELGIIRQLQFSTEDKVVYMSPTKALCQERVECWRNKFGERGVSCAELTGDSDWEASTEARRSTIIVTTPEKWDSMTRKWTDYSTFFSKVRIACIDECHSVADKRGSVLEAVISRMKTLGNHIRFIAVSATIPNVDDIAKWISFGLAEPAKSFAFGDSYRPVPLRKIVVAKSRNKIQNDFSFNVKLRSQLVPIIKEYSDNLSTIVFCSTRNECIQSADVIYRNLINKPIPGWSSRDVCNVAFHDAKLKNLSTFGIAFHHGGLDFHDRHTVEDQFKQGTLRVICTTSTLAVGVNLPAHLVIIKGTKRYSEGWADYTDMEIIQMMGRAGRPQFDTFGVAVILTDTDSKQKYERLANCTEALESSLHESLIEHLISEMSLGIITNTNSAVTWLRRTFLSVRIKANPVYYGIDSQTPEKKLEELLFASVKQMKEDGIILGDKDSDELCSTVFCDIMSRLYINYKTFVSLISVAENATMRDVLHIISNATEFSNIQLRAGERKAFTDIQKLSEIRFGLQNVTNVAEKIFSIIQIVLGGVPLSDLPEETKEARTEIQLIWKPLTRLCQCFLDLSVAKKRGDLIRTAQSLHCSVNAKAWEDSPVIFRQLDGVGERYVKKLSAAGIVTWDQLRKQDPLRLSSILGQNMIGHKVLKQVKNFPKLQMTVKVDESIRKKSEQHLSIEVELSMERDSSAANQFLKKSSTASLLILASDNQWMDFRRLKLERLCDGPKSLKTSLITGDHCHELKLVFSQDNLAGNRTEITYHLDRNKHSNIADNSQQYPKHDSYTERSYKAEEQSKIANASQSYGKHDTCIEQKRKQREKTENSRMLPNGKYECLHTCKNKTVCRHICCKDGVSKPMKRQQSNQSTISQKRDRDIAKRSKMQDEFSGSEFDELADLPPLDLYFETPSMNMNIEGINSRSASNPREKDLVLNVSDLGTHSQEGFQLTSQDIPYDFPQSPRDITLSSSRNNSLSPNRYLERRYVNITSITSPSARHSSSHAPLTSDRQFPGGAQCNDYDWFKEWINNNVEIID